MIPMRAARMEDSRLDNEEAGPKTLMHTTNLPDIFAVLSLMDTNPINLLNFISDDTNHANPLRFLKPIDHFDHVSMLSSPLDECQSAQSPSTANIWDIF